MLFYLKDTNSRSMEKFWALAGSEIWAHIV